MARCLHQCDETRVAKVGEGSRLTRSVSVDLEMETAVSNTFITA